MRTGTRFEMGAWFTFRVNAHIDVRTRVIENKHLIRNGSMIHLQGENNAHTDARTSTRFVDSSSDDECYSHQPRADSARGNTTSVECVVSIPPLPCQS